MSFKQLFEVLDTLASAKRIKFMYAVYEVLKPEVSGRGEGNLNAYERSRFYGNPYFLGRPEYCGAWQADPQVTENQAGELAQFLGNGHLRADFEMAVKGETELALKQIAVYEDRIKAAKQLFIQADNEVRELNLKRVTLRSQVEELKNEQRKLKTDITKLKKSAVPPKTK